MSRISPFHFNVNEYDIEEIENICPRYLKWMQKVKAFDFSKRKKGKIERTMPSFDSRYKLGDSSRPPKRSKSFLSKIRKGGQNLRVRVRTSADLWRRWIRGGIMYSTEINEKDEQEYEELEKVAQTTVKDVLKLNPINEINEKESKQLENTKTDVIIEVTEIDRTDEIENKNSEISVKTEDNKKPEENSEILSEKSDTNDIQSSLRITIEEEVEVVDQNIATTVEEVVDRKIITEEEVVEQKIITEEEEVNQKIITEEEVIVGKIVSENEEQVIDQQTNRNIENSTLSTNTYKDSMPEVVANND